MRKRRNAKNHRHLRGGATAGKIVGRGDRGKGCENRFAVFEFSDIDEQVEMDSLDSVSHFRSHANCNKPTFRHPVDHYDFFQCFSRGTTTSQNNSVKTPVVITIDDISETTTVAPENLVYASSNCILQYASSNHDSKCFSAGDKSHTCRKGGHEYFTPDKKLNKELYIDSVNHSMTELSSRTSSFDLVDSGGSAEELASDSDTDANDCESVVAVTPSYVKFGSMYYTESILSFSSTCIKMEGSSLCEGKSPHNLEWPIVNITKIDYQQYESVKANVVNIYFKFKDSNNDSGNHNLISADTVELEFVVIDDSQWSKKQEEIKALDTKYKAAWRTITNTQNSLVFFEEIIYPEGDSDAVSVSWRDLELLQPRTFINDTIIDFYMKYISTETLAENQHRFHFFNTFFFLKLSGLDQNSSIHWEGKEAFQRVRKWTRNLNLFEKDYIFIPVNISLHWSLIVICHLGKVAGLRENEVCDSAEMPCILHLDSLRGSHRGIENFIQSYLCEEWKERSNDFDTDVSTKFLKMPFVSLQLPQQENLFDCGLFLLHYAEIFLELVPSLFMAKYSDIFHKNLFLPAEVSLKKRDHIRNLIYRIAENNSMKNPPAVDEACPRDYNEDDTDSGVKFVKEINTKDICYGLKLDSSDDQEIHVTPPVSNLNIGEHQPFIDVSEPRKVANSVSHDIFQPHEQFVSIHQFSNMRLPAEEEVLETPTFRPGHSDNSHKANYPRHSPYMHGSRAGIGKAEDCLPDIKQEKNKRELSASEDLEACIVEDSEDEDVIQSVGRSRRWSVLETSATNQLDASHHQPVCFNWCSLKTERKGKKR